MWSCWYFLWRKKQYLTSANSSLLRLRVWWAIDLNWLIASNGDWQICVDLDLRLCWHEACYFWRGFGEQRIWANSFYIWEKWKIIIWNIVDAKSSVNAIFLNILVGFSKWNSGQSVSKFFTLWGREFIFGLVCHILDHGLGSSLVLELTIIFLPFSISGSFIFHITLLRLLFQQP